VDNPFDRLKKENRKLVDNCMRLERENDDLAQELLTTCDSKIKLRASLDQYEDKADTLSTELFATRALLVEVEDERKRLEDEVKCLKVRPNPLFSCF
jgi:chromosome segregation ATPase